MFAKKTILLVALLPLTVASMIMHRYMSMYHASCFEDDMTPECSVMIGSFAIAFTTAVTINLCQLGGFHWLPRLLFLRRGLRGMRAFGFFLGVVSCIPVNFARPITHLEICAGLLMVVWGYLVDIATDLDLGLSGILSGVLVGIGIVPLAPTAFPTSRGNDNVGWLVIVGLILGVILMIITDWAKRKLKIVKRKEELSQEPSIAEADLDGRLETLRTRLSQATRMSETACRQARLSQLRRDNVSLQRAELESLVKQRLFDLNEHAKEWVNLKVQLTNKNNQKQVRMGEIEDFKQYLAMKKAQHHDRHKNDWEIMESLYSANMEMVSEIKDMNRDISSSRLQEQTARTKLSSLDQNRMMRL